jgi:hypothetical protein
MKYLSKSLILICAVIANIAIWAGHEAAIERTDEIIFHYHPLPPYIPKSREELIVQYRNKYPLYGVLSPPDPSPEEIYWQGEIDRDVFKERHLAKYQDVFKSRIDAIFGGIEVVFALLLIWVLFSWLKTSFTRLAEFIGTQSFSKKAKLLLLEKELNSLRRMRDQGLVSDDAFNSKSIELQEKATKLLH